ncbi:replicative DNA helicase [Simkania negevensis]|uniref:Replicative DNA helicase n=1 Tax=Simkania negevensis TaxID=83561 RepID=A0ABS3AQW3_9BACT|nr:replicative DNA helicase [Simkania negevensis]
MTKIKVAPNSKESEMMVLGCMLTSMNSLNIGCSHLDDSDFYYTEHKITFSALRNAYVNDEPADIHIISEELKRTDKLDAIGGVSYLTTLAQYAGTSAYIEEYAKLVGEKSILRKMINAAQLIEKDALNEPDDVFGSLDNAQKMLFQISHKASTDQGVVIQDILSGAKTESKIPYLQELEERQERFRLLGPDEPGITGIPTHFTDLDKLINGLSPSNLMILAGRPAMGKTMLALNIAENVCFKNKMPVGIFSLEMSSEQILHRLVSSQAEVEAEKIKRGALNGPEYQQVVAAVNEMQKHTMIIDDQPGLAINDLRARARRMKESHDVRLIVVDYLQLLSGSGSSRSTESRQNEISEISRILKTTARELDVPILCLSQLSRKVEERTGHRPMMSDLRESGSIEQDADVVIFLLRREYYDPLDRPGMAELIVGKNRHGSVGTVNLTFRGDIVQFTNYTNIAFEEAPDLVKR